MQDTQQDGTSEFIDRMRCAGARRKARVDPAIPGYELVEELHRGGQGVVYRATQLATSRDVALKLLINGAFATSRQRRRFQREIRVVGAMRHPNIVTVHDCGVGDDDVPFLVMELIDGRPLDTWATQRAADARWPVPERLRIVLGILDALGYAHRRTVVHRDIKPGNVLIDADDNPRVVDFGLAKLTGDQHAATSDPTVPGGFVGTFRYASPEQLRSVPEDVDTRSDIYAVGMILYELLTGAHPVGPQAAVCEIIDRVVNGRFLPPSALSPDSNADLDAIVMKALEPDPNRRYQTTDDMSADIERYLNGYPVHARRGTMIYRTRKFARRNRTLLTCILALLTLFGTAGGLFESKRRAEVSANHFRGEAENLGDVLNQLLSSGHLSTFALPNDSIQEILGSATDLIDDDQMSPETSAALRHTVGSTYVAVESIDEAIPLLKESLALRRATLPKDDPRVAETLISLGDAFIRALDAPNAESSAREAIAILRANPQPRDPSLELRADSLLGRCLVAQGRLEEAASLLEETVRRRWALGSESSLSYAEFIIPYVGVLSDQRRITQSNRVLVDQYERVLEEIGPDSLDAAALMKNIARNEARLGNEQRAVEFLHRTIDICRADRSITARNTHALALRELVRIESDRGAAYTEPLVRETLAIEIDLFGGDHHRPAATWNDLGEHCRVRGAFAEAEHCFEQAIRIRRANVADRPIMLTTSLCALARLKLDLGLAEEAEPFVREALHIKLQDLPRRKPNRPRNQRRERRLLAEALVLQERWVEARAEIDACIQSQRYLQRIAPAELAHVNCLLALCLVQEGDSVRAEALFETCVGAMEPDNRDGNLRAWVFQHAIEFYEAHDRHERAAYLRGRIAGTISEPADTAGS